MLVGREAIEGGVLLATAGGDKRVDDLRVDHRAACRDLGDGADELVDVGDPLLQQVGPPLGPFVEELERVAGLHVLAEDHDADAGVRGPDRLGGADALVGAGRRHPDVGHDDVGLVLGHEGEERIEVFAGADHLDVVVGVEEPGDRLADQIVVFGDDDTDRHGASRLRELRAFPGRPPFRRRRDPLP